jgi:hypothetical protein
MLSKLQDLDFLEVWDESEPVVGGVFASVQVSTSTNLSLAAASAEAIAIGAKTFTSANTKTNLVQTSFSTNSYARADGKASAQTGGSLAKSSATQISYFGYVNYISM